MSGQKSESYEGKPLSKFRKRLVISIIVGLGIFVALSIYADVGEVTQAFAKFRWAYIPLILTLTFLNYLLRFFKWHYYLGCIGIKVRGIDSLGIFLSGLAMAVTPAKLGEVFKSYLLKRLNGTEVSKSVPVIIAERISDMLGLLILAAMSFSALKYGLEVLIIVLSVLLALIAILQSRLIYTKLLELSKKISHVNRLSDSLTAAYESAYTLFRFKILLVAVSISVLSWGFECLAMYLVLAGFGTDASVLLSTFVSSFSTLAGGISMVPGGLGVAEGSFVGLLILAGIPKSIAAGATVIIRFCTLWFGVTVGLITLFVIRKKIA